MHNFIKVEYATIKQNDYNLVFSRYVQPTINNSGKSTAKWEMVKLGDVVDLLRGPFGSAIKREVCVNSGYKVYEQGNVINNNFCIGKYYIDNQRFQILSKFEIKENDILLTCAGTLGKVAIVPSNIEKGIINSVLMRLRVKNSTILCIKYFAYLIQTQYMQNELILKSTGVGLKNMRAGKEIKELQLPLPPIETQYKIVEEFESIETRIKQIQDIIKQEQERFDCILNELFYA